MQCGTADQQTQQHHFVAQKKSGNSSLLHPSARSSRRTCISELNKRNPGKAELRSAI